MICYLILERKMGVLHTWTLGTRVLRCMEKKGKESNVLLKNRTTQLSLLATYFALMLPMYMYPPSQFLALALIGLFIPLLTRRHLGYWIILEGVIAMQALVMVLAYDLLVFPEALAYLAPIVKLSAGWAADGTLAAFYFANPLVLVLMLAGMGVIYLLVIRPSIWLAKSILDARRRVKLYLGKDD